MDYQDIMDAVRIIGKARLELYKTEPGGPAWTFLMNAAEHLKKQAEAILRDGGSL